MIEKHQPKLTQLLHRFSNLEILVVGDLILDEFVWGQVERISPEAPVPVVEVTRESARLGGAANVAANLSVLGANPSLIGVIGDDRAGQLLVKEAEEQGIGIDGIVRDPGRRTSVKTRIIAHHQQVCRTDRESRAPVSANLRSRLQEIYQSGLDRARGVILSDYAKGMLGADDARKMITSARNQGHFVVVDPKAKDFLLYRGATVITPNKKELEEASMIPLLEDKDLIEAGRSVRAQSAVEYLLVTRGEEGMTLFELEGERQIPTMAREVFDVTGAGDTVVAVLALALAAGGSMYEAALLANCAAGVVVGKLGTAAVTTEEILDSLSRTESDQNSDSMNLRARS